MESYWNLGDSVIFRGFGFRKLWFAMPCTLVRDSEALVALYWRAGTPWKGPCRRPVAKDLLEKDPLQLVDLTWTGTDVLLLALPSASHSVYAMWDCDSSELVCWYINLETPLKRTPMGFDTMDHMLDIVVSPDRLKWRWKDEDEFAEGIAAGIYSVEEADRIRTEGERAVSLLQADDSPYAPGWADWKPPVQWRIPVLPSGWDRMVETETFQE